MQNIGDKLEEARKRQGVTIREAAEATKIRADFLIDFENNNFNQDLPDIYKRGFLKLYAKFLNLEAEKMITDFNAGQLGVVAPSRKDKNLGVVKVDSNYSHHNTETPNSDQQGSEEWQSDKSVYIKIAAVLGIVIVVMAFAAMIINYVTAEKESTEEPVTKTNIETNNDSYPDVTTGATEVEIYLIAIGDCFITVQGNPDRNIFYTSSLSAGERVPVKIQGPVYIISDAMENIQVEKNGTTYTAPGKGVGKFLLE